MQWRIFPHPYTIAMSQPVSEYGSARGEYGRKCEKGI